MAKIASPVHIFLVSQTSGLGFFFFWVPPAEVEKGEPKGGANSSPFD